jgi:hypothetical protein
VGSRPLRKKLTYRDRTGKTQAQHAAIWRGFVFQAGPVVVSLTGPWGEIQVWAASEGEGRRVCSFAAAAGGWDAADPGAEWDVGVAGGGRNGRTGRMVVKETPLGIEVTKRSGPSGFPSIG